MSPSPLKYQPPPPLIFLSSGLCSIIIEKMKMKREAALLFTILFYSSLTTYSFWNGSEEERADAALLMNFKSTLSSPSVLYSWLPDHDPCTSFQHIVCNGSHVSSLNLTSIPLYADLSSVVAYLVRLHSLTSIYLSSTNLTTLNVPSPFSCSSSLSTIDLSSNSISYHFFHLLLRFCSCSNLNSFNLSRNRITLASPFYTFPSEAAILWYNRIELLDLSFNSISVCFPLPLLLKHLSLQRNQADGNITHISSSKSLLFLDLSSNNFNGGLVGELLGCDSLVFLNLSSNKFEGDVPLLSKSGNLKTLDLSYNGFTRLFAREWDFCSGLMQLDLSLNKLRGSIPQGLGSCSLLEDVDLSGNFLTGGISGEGDVWRGMRKLKRLVLGNNSFNGSIPLYFSKMLALEYLDLSSNNMSGSIAGICGGGGGGGGGLKQVYLQNNGFSGEIDRGLCECRELVSVDLSLNYLTGRIPACVGGLRGLRDLVAWMNKLEGEIPNELGGLGLLESLILDFNNFKGGIPNGLGNCTSLVWISLSNNMMVGPIPRWISKMRSLAILNLANNSFAGHIPSEIGDCPSLIWLDLNTNLLLGSLPPTLFKQSGKIVAALFTRKRFAYVKNNGGKRGCHGAGSLLEFSGIRSDQVSRISTRSSCDYSRVYGGTIQPTFHHNGSLIFLDLSYNSLSGLIPKEMGRPFYLSVLDLAHNNLSGPIPADLGSLSSLNILDLSFNTLSGPIPPSLTRLSGLSELDLSNNLLSGLIPNSAQFDSFPDSRYQNNSALCGLPLPPAPPPAAAAPASPPLSPPPPWQV